jgi:hypothetical protein
MDKVKYNGRPIAHVIQAKFPKFNQPPPTHMFTSFKLPTQLYLIKKIETERRIHSTFDQLKVEEKNWVEQYHVER